MTKWGRGKALIGGLGLGAALLLSGCDPFAPELIELYANGELRSYWTEAAKKAQAEADLEDEIDDAVDGAAGRVIWDAWYWPAVTLEGASNVNVNLGTRSPVLDVTRVVQYTSSVTGDKTVVFDWTATWAAGNGANLSLEVNLDNAPDPLVTVGSISATIRGTTTLTMVGDRAVVIVVITSATTNLSATGRVTVAGFTITFSLTNEVKRAVGSSLCRDVIEKAFTVRASELKPLLDGNPPGGSGLTGVAE